MRKLIVVDMQNDFITGPLGTPEARAIVPAVCDLIRNGRYDRIIYTMDCHQDNYPSTLEGKSIPPHCKRYEEGWMMNEDVLGA